MLCFVGNSFTADMWLVCSIKQSGITTLELSRLRTKQPSVMLYFTCNDMQNCLLWKRPTATAKHSESTHFCFFSIATVLSFPTYLSMTYRKILFNGKDYDNMSPCQFLALCPSVTLSLSRCLSLLAPFCLSAPSLALIMGQVGVGI